MIRDKATVVFWKIHGPDSGCLHIDVPDEENREAPLCFFDKSDALKQLRIERLDDASLRLRRVTRRVIKRAER